MSEVHYYSNYTDTRDIDCFFRVGNVAYHFASNGQPIPSFIKRKTNMAVQEAVYELLENAKGEVVVNDVIIRQLILKELEGLEGAKADSLDERGGIDAMIIDYADSFKSMARLGFISMDLDEDGIYHVIATPTDQVVPDRIMKLLPVVGEGIVTVGNKVK